MIDWVMLVPSVVFTKIKTDFPEDLKTKFSMTGNNFSTVDESNTEAVFPFVFVKLLPASEVGADLVGKDINAGLFTFQIDVYDNKSKSRAREVMTAVLKTMKSMSFNVISMPEFSTTSGRHRSTMRVRRIIGSGDIL